ncbi:hypothetical protein SAY86_028545 [Trapa natans]|uniref:Uncharacterized protein n=1 Tax=Trapa natans TaxID=22666 RepID=A0AAN7R8Q7_TRANT|nr:hypothetical protein SAY86_028545 [Trapa natans]
MLGSNAAGGDDSAGPDLAHVESAKAPRAGAEDDHAKEGSAPRNKGSSLGRRALVLPPPARLPQQEEHSFIALAVEPAKNCRLCTGCKLVKVPLCTFSSSLSSDLN